MNESQSIHRLLVLLVAILLFLHQTRASHLHISNVIIRAGSGPNHDHQRTSYPPFSVKEFVAKLKVDREWFSKDSIRQFGLSTGKMSLRVPNAIKETIFSSCGAFFSSLMTIVPIGLIYNIKQIRTVKVWLKSGLLTGVEWSKVSAIYVGGESFCKAVRGVDDRYNAYIGSGLASALLRIQEGPVGMLQGFAIGYMFLLAVDSVMKHSDSSIALPVIEHHGDHGTSLAKILFNHKSASPMRKPKLPKLPTRPRPRLPPSATRIVTNSIRKVPH